MQLLPIYERQSQGSKTQIVEIKRQKKIHHANNIHKKPGMATLMSNELDLKTRNITTEKKKAIS